LQQSHSQLQSGQSLQQSSEQQAAALVPQTASREAVLDTPTMPAESRMAPIARLPNSLVNITKLTFCQGNGDRAGMARLLVKHNICGKPGAAGGCQRRRKPTSFESRQALWPGGGRIK